MNLTTTELQRFWAKVNKTDTCWLWTAALNTYGYGHFNVNKKGNGAHRIAYQITVRKLTTDQILDHICRVRHCVNPSHMRVCTNKENILDKNSQSSARLNKEKTICPKGHPYNFSNTYIHPTGRRCCRKCATERARRKRENE